MTGSNERVLVVDDNETNRKLVQVMLSTAGYDVDLAEGGAQAMTAFEAAPAALVLLDIVMPGMDGFETLARLRALPRGRTTPVMVVTALADVASIQRAIELGADDFVTKPINRTELLVRVAALLGARRPGARASGSDAVVLERDEPPRSAGVQGELAPLLVHDLKHPLTTIYFDAGLLKRDPTLSAQARGKVERILRACHTLDGMIMSILDVTGHDAGSLRLDVRELDLGALLGGVVASMEPHAAANKQHLELVRDPAARRLRGDEDLLRRMLENLLDNATKYGPPYSTIRLEVAARNGGLTFRVRDRGPGIPPERRGDVFEQPRGGRRSGRRGRGLGLVLVRIAAEAHGGRAWVEDDPDGGTCFCVEVAA